MQSGALITSVHGLVFAWLLLCQAAAVDKEETRRILFRTIVLTRNRIKVSLIGSIVTNIVRLLTPLGHHDQTGCHRYYNLDNSKQPQKSNDRADTKSFEVIQHAGEAIYVPSTWKHSVINLLPGDDSATKKDIDIDGGRETDKIENLPPLKWCATATATATKRKHPNSRSNALFINHNWIIAVALDKTLECIVVEAYAVKKEMEAWV